ncbi:biofilm development regulator YmgB/AriR family protein (plasmid) [Franconibacter pulveris]
MSAFDDTETVPEPDVNIIETIRMELMSRNITPSNQEIIYVLIALLELETDVARQDEYRDCLKILIRNS